MFNLYVITDQHSKYYHQRDAAKTGRLLCGVQYIMGRDTILDEPPPGRELCPECARILSDRARGISRPMIGDEKGDG